MTTKSHKVESEKIRCNTICGGYKYIKKNYNFFRNYRKRNLEGNTPKREDAISGF